MDLNKFLENERKWKYFLSSIKTFKYLPTNNVTIKTKHNTNSLCTDFANKLLQKKGGTIKLTGKADVLNKYKHLDIQNSEKISHRPESNHQLNLIKAETWPKSKNRSIDIDNSERESISRVLPFDTQGDPSPVLSDHDDSERSLKRYNDRKIGVDEVGEVSFVPSKRARTSNITETSGTNDIMMQDADLKKEERNGMEFDQGNIAKSDTTVNEKSNTDIKTDVPKSEDEVDSSFLSMAGVAKAIPLNFQDSYELQPNVQGLPSEAENTNVTDSEYADKIHVAQPDITENKTIQTNLNIGSVPCIIAKEVLKKNTKVEDEVSTFSNETEKEATTSIQVAAEDFIHVNDTININRSRERYSYTPPKKSDIDKPCSTWKVQDIAEYFIFDECVTSIAVPDKPSSFLDDVYEFVLKDVIRRLETVKGADLTKRKRSSDSEMLVRLKSITSTETGSRLILDALLIPLCSALDIQIEVDKNIDCHFLPNCRFDYCLKKGHKIIGCVEAKSIKSLSESSVAQALLQLTILQTALIANEGDESLKDTPVFVIVTDGHRFIYIQLKGQYLGFEHDNEKLKIREIRNENDFKQIMHHISFLINGEDSQNSDVIVID